MPDDSFTPHYFWNSDHITTSCLKAFVFRPLSHLRVYPIQASSIFLPYFRGELVKIYTSLKAHIKYYLHHETLIDSLVNMYLPELITHPRHAPSILMTMYLSDFLTRLE